MAPGACREDLLPVSHIHFRISLLRVRERRRVGFSPSSVTSVALRAPVPVVVDTRDDPTRSPRALAWMSSRICELVRGWSLPPCAQASVESWVMEAEVPKPGDLLSSPAQVAFRYPQQHLSALTDTSPVSLDGTSCLARPRLHAQQASTTHRGSPL